jgi:hypothetical protein
MRFDRAKDVLEVAPLMLRNAAAERAVHFLNDHLAILHRPSSSASQTASGRG